MRNLLRPLMISAAVMAVGGCSFFSDNYLRDWDFPGVYKINVQQGNVVEQSLIDELRPNMTKEQVASILGTPLVRETFNKNRWDYIKSVQLGGKARKQQRVSVFFDNNHLVSITGDLHPTMPSEERNTAQPKAVVQ